MARVQPAYGSLTGMRDQGLKVGVLPRDQAPADYLGAGTRREQDEAQRQLDAMPYQPPAYMWVETR